MICNAQIHNVRNIKSSPGSAKSFDFWVLRFLDVDNPDTDIEECSIEAKDVQALAALRGKVVQMHIHKSGKYLNFAGIIQKAA